MPDDPFKAAQVASLEEQREKERSTHGATKRAEDTAKKREAELDALTKKKNEAEKKQFKRGQEDLEKELGF